MADQQFERHSLMRPFLTLHGSPRLKPGRPMQGQGLWSFCSQQATLRRPDKAFAAFFRRVKSADMR
ncbi:hypothetical protein AB0F46_41960 [Streptomyces sp. NPDC026665]|uniref:hypothetical protein n=1 Tax=Streptomyces sp. NPDC026665 TaxID=3154798 RepID=UPI0033EEF0D1